MYYLLKENYALRGWKKKTGVLVNRVDNSIKDLNQMQLGLLMMCDGATDFSEDMLSENEAEYLHKCIENNIVATSENQMKIADDQLYIYYDNRYVESAFWSITGRCNFKCRHCYMDAPDAKFGELSHEKAMNLIDQMNDCGILKVDITGGEPFVRKDFWELIDHILSYKMVIRTIYTNAWVLNDDVLDKFEQRNMHPEISVSFDGIGWHDWMRGVKGAEDAAMRAFRMCKERGFNVDIECALHKGNWNLIRETINALAEAGVYDIRLGPVQNTELWEKNSEGNSISTEEYDDKILEYIPKFYQDGMPANVFCGGLMYLKKDSTEYEIPFEIKCTDENEDKLLNRHLCGAVRYSCYITPEGRLLPCMPMTSCNDQSAFPLIEDIGLKAGLSESYYMKFVDSRVKDLLRENEKCNSCQHKLCCGGGCRAGALMSGNGLMGSDPDQCAFWNGNYMEKIHRTADEAIEKYCNKSKK